MNMKIWILPILLLFLCGCGPIKIQLIKEETEIKIKEKPTERERIFKVFKKEQRLLLLAFLETEFGKEIGEFKIASHINNYYSDSKCPAVNGFYVYFRNLLRKQIAFDDDIIQLIRTARMHYFLLEKMYAEKPDKEKAK